MNIKKILALAIVLFFSCSLLSTDLLKAEDQIDNLVSADFYIKYESATDLTIEVIIEAEKLTTDQIYDSTGIKTASQQELGAFRHLLYQMLEKQIKATFENAEILNFSMPTFDGESFNEILNLKLSSSYFGLNETVNPNNFLNGVLDIGAIINYTIDFQAEPGWNNTYRIELGEDIGLKRTNGIVEGAYFRWNLKNWNGNNPNRIGELRIISSNPTTTKESEDIFLEYILDSKDVEPVSLNTNIILKTINIEKYDIVPEFVYNLDYIPADGIRLFIDNGFLTWDDFYDKTVKPIEEKIISNVDKSSYNKTLDFVFNWDETSTTNIQNPYDLTNMDDKPNIKAILKDSKVNLRLFDISSKALFGLINAGAKANISKEDINFGDNLDSIVYDYNISLILPEDIYLEGKGTYTWNESKTISGEFESDVSENYNEEEKDTIVEIEIKNTDLNLLSFFTGKTEITFGLDIKGVTNYNLSSLPDSLNLPQKIKIDYLNADAIRLCVEEEVFSEEDLNDFLKDEKDFFQSNIRTVLKDAEINANINRGIFDESISSWDSNISKMDSYPPVKTSSYAYTIYPVYFDLSFVPPSFNIVTKKFNFTGIEDQKVIYKVIFPQGISIETSDSLSKSLVKQTTDGRDYIEISFEPNEGNLSVEVSCKMTASAFFIAGIFVPCIISFVIALILIIVIYMIRKRRGGRKTIRVPQDEEGSGYEDEKYYIPPGAR